jgi:hypothetical protein
VRVRDTTPPAVACPADVLAEATGPAGAAVSFPSAVATDAVTAPPAVAYGAVSGSQFPQGETIVTATATDEAGNTASCSFRVTVRDTTAPAIACPASLSVRTPKKEGAYVSYAAPTATDAVTPIPTVTASPPSGFFFPVGATTVTGTATDDAGNAATCSFEVTVTRH